MMTPGRLSIKRIPAARFCMTAILLLCAVSWTLFAEEELIGSRLNAGVQSSYQRWQTGNAATETYSELSTNLFLYAPLMRHFGIGINGAVAGTNGHAHDLSGMTDLKISANYYIQPLNIIFSMNVNLPSGKTEMTVDEMKTAAIIGDYVFRYRVPSFGQGLNISPGLIWVHTLSDNMALGLGTTYQFLGSFRPMEILGSFDPGDQLLFTGGIDFRFSPVSTVSMDIVFIYADDDRLDGEALFAAGAKLNANLHFEQFFGFHRWQLSARYRSQASNKLLINQQTVDAIPTSFFLGSEFRVRISENFSLGLLTEGRGYDLNERTYSDGYLVEAGLLPRVSITPDFHIPARIVYRNGAFRNDTSLTGLEWVIGIEYQY